MNKRRAVNMVEGNSKYKKNVSKAKVQLLALVIIIVGTLIVYWQAHKQEFIDYDDTSFIVENSYIQRGLTWENVNYAFTSTTGSIWLPLTYLSHAVDCQLYGLNPAGHKWTNVIFHLGNALLLYYLLYLMTGSIWSSVFVSLLFAWHPLNLESVAWIAERKNVLSTFFGFLTLIAYYGYVKSPGIRRYFWVTFFFVLSLLAKPMLVTLPFLLLLLDFWPLKRSGDNSPSSDILARSKNKNFPDNMNWKEKRLFYRSYRNIYLYEKIPLFLITIAMSIVAFATQKTTGATVDLQNIPILIRIGNAAIAYCKYILKMFWPSNLSIFYPYPIESITLSQIIGAAILLLVASFYIFWRRKYLPYMFVGWFWYVGTLVPVIGIVQVGQQSMADRYAYIPLVGLFILITYYVNELIQRHRIPVAAVAVLGITVALFLGISTKIQLQYWKDRISIWNHALTSSNGNNYLAHGNIGMTLLERGKDDEAMSHFFKAIGQNPYFDNSHFFLGLIFHKQEKYDKAIECFNRVLEIKPDDYETHNNLGMAFLKKRDYANAIIHLSKAIKEAPQVADNYNNYGLCFLEQKKIDEAIVQFRKAVFFNPKHAQAELNWGCALKENKKLDEALIHFSKAEMLDKNLMDAKFNIGLVMLEQNKIDMAIDYLKKYLKDKPKDHVAQNSLGIAFLKKKDYQEALNQFRKVVEMEPNYAEGYNNMGICFLEQKRFAEAKIYFFKARKMEANLEKSNANLQDKLRGDPKVFQSEKNIDEDSANVYNSRGISFAKERKFPEAIYNFQKAIEINPQFVKAHNNLGAALVQQGKLEEAVNQYKKVIALDPSNASAQLIVGKWYVVQGKMDEAINHYQQALKHVKNSAEIVNIYKFMGQALIKAGKKEDAEIAFRKAQSLTANLTQTKK